MPKRFGMNDVFGLGQSSIAPFVLDRLPATAGSWSFGRRKRRGWLGPVGTLYRTSDGVEIPVFGEGRWGLANPRLVRAFNGWNLLPRTEDLTNAAWFKLNSTVEESSTAPPPGFSKAFKLIENTSNSEHVVLPFTFPTVLASTTYTLTIFAKRAERSRIYLRNASITSAGTYFDLAAGTIISNDANVVWSQIEDAGNGWFRCSVAATTTSTAANTGVRLVNTGQNTTYTGDGTSGVFITGFQLEPGSRFTAYQKRETTGSSNVLWSRLFDQSGNGLHFEQANAALMPYACRAGVPVTENGVLAGEFVESEARRMVVANSTSAFNFMHTTGGTIAAVSRAANTASAKVILRNKTASNIAGFQMVRNGDETVLLSAGRLNVGGVATNGNSIDTSFFGTASIVNNVVVARMDPDNATASSRSEVWQNGTKSVTTTSQTGVPFIESPLSNLTLGANPSGASAFEGTISDADIWQGELTTAQRQLYERDAARHWGFVVA